MSFLFFGQYSRHQKSHCEMLCYIPCSALLSGRLHVYLSTITVSRDVLLGLNGLVCLVVFCLAVEETKIALMERISICGFHNINCKYDFINAIELYFIIIFLKYVNTLDTLKLTGTFY